MALSTNTGTLSTSQTTDSHGLSVVTPLSPRDLLDATTPESNQPPSFSSLFFAPTDSVDARLKTCDCPDPQPDHESPPAFAPAPPFTESSSSAASAAAAAAAAATTNAKHAPRKDIDDGEPPPPYTEGTSPLESFTYVMASAGGPASIITQVSQTGPAPPINTLGGSDENITLELRSVLLPISPLNTR